MLMYLLLAACCLPNPFSTPTISMQAKRLAIVCMDSESWLAIGGTIPAYWGNGKGYCASDEEFVATVCASSNLAEDLDIGPFLEEEWNVVDPTVEMLQQHLCR